MGFTLIIGATALALSCSMVWIVWMAVGKLPDE